MRKGLLPYRSTRLVKGLLFLLLSIWILGVVPVEWLHDSFFSHHDTAHLVHPASQYGDASIELGHKHCADPFTILHHADLLHLVMYKMGLSVHVESLPFSASRAVLTKEIVCVSNRGPPLSFSW